MTRTEPSLSRLLPEAHAPKAVVIGAGLGGLASAMRLGAKGYTVTLLDRLDGPGGRGSAIVRDGHRFDLGPTIVTVPGVFRDLWAACGRDFDADVDLRALDPSTRFAGPTARFSPRGRTRRRCGPRWSGCHRAKARATTAS